MSAFSSWRTALRIARRETRRARGRSALVVAMIALPVLFLTFAAVTYDMFTLTGAEKADRSMGAADARIQWGSRSPVMQQPDPDDGFLRVGGRGDETTAPPDTAELLRALPAGSAAIPMWRGSARLRTADGIGQPNAIVVDATNPMTRGYVDVLAGRAPTGASEVALTEDAMARLGAGIDGRISSADGLRQYTVVGEVEFPSLLSEVVLFGPGTDTKGDGFSTNESAWLVDTPGPITWDQVVRYNQSGLVVESRAVFLDPPPADAVPFNRAYQGFSQEQLALTVLVAGLALLEIVLLAGPAFAVGARRRQRQLALVAANGGTPAQIRRIVLADGVVLGLVGAVVGIVLGVAAGFVGRPYVEQLIANSRAGGYRVFPVALAVIAGLAVFTGVLAALVPAYVAARQNVIAALAGRRGVIRSRKRWIAVGLTMTALGIVVAVFGTFRIDPTIILAGLILGELGVVLCTPAIVGFVARLGRILPLTPRIALRDAARNRSSAAPAISAVMAAVAGSVALGLYLDSGHTLHANTYAPNQPTGTVTVSLPDNSGPAVLSTLESQLRSALPVADVYRTLSVTCIGGNSLDRAYPCLIDTVVVPEFECPQLRIMTEGHRQLTRDEMRAARSDPRCAADRRYGQIGGQSLVDDGTALAALTGASGDDLERARAVLRSGGVVVTNPSFIKDGQVTVAYLTDPPASPATPSLGTGKAAAAMADPMLTAPRMTLPGYLLTTATIRGASVVSPGAVAKVGLATAEQGLIATTTRMPTTAEEDRISAVMESLPAYPYIERGVSNETDPRLWALIAAAVAITIGAAAVGAGLAAADGRADLSTLAAVGASPRVRRGLSLSQSGVIAVLGSVLGTVAGVGTAVAVITALNQRFIDIWPGRDPLPIVVPWLSLAIALIGAPLVAILGAGLFTRSRLPIERRL